MPRSKIFLFLPIGLAAFAVGLWLSFDLGLYPERVEPPTIAGFLITPPKVIEDFTLIDQSGQSFHQDRWRGQWTFLYFGYTFCPDVCPLTLLELGKLQKILEREHLDQNTAYLFVSVDPKRDLPQRLGEYTAYFNPKFRGATGTAEELAKLAQQLGIYYKILDSAADGQNYTVDHSTAVLLIDPQARLRAVFTQHSPDTMAADFRKILELPPQ
ncbi:MAG: SCO family protein [Candidatus Competibacteraceae bacterium]|uniref:Electron transport protein SCO1/SenC n=1 Tax=Candidatus Contendobacter odensis Run_B_J11 TaxID=1400861 RepID=A0A7U7J1T5_9GAMM|nr:SCO family protein [Candidatus Contendobacter odensis]MBK8534903.1 SCO family protein [Candidatus Competibacteraceae bacterium]CDH43191.1 putative Electron transport protein SCO1/SenC [Candidatus Contendobacter odensis Run_B_J11]